MKRILSPRKGLILGILVLTIAATLMTWAKSSASGSAAAGTPVEVVNTSQHPVPITGAVTVGNFGEEPFQVRLTGPGAEFTVPIDRRLVIKYVSGQASNSTACQLSRVVIETRVSGATLDHSFIPTQTATTSTGVPVYTIGQETTLYADAGTTVRLNFGVTPELPCSPFVSVAVSGHLEKGKF